MAMVYDNRALLLQEALRLFAARGYDAVAVQEIVDAAGVTKPTFYHYFGSKAGVLLTLLQTRLDTLYGAVAQAAAYQGDLTMNLRSVARAYFDMTKAEPLFFQYYLSLRHAPPDSASYQAVAERNEALGELLVRLFAEALPHMAGRHRRYAVTFVGMLTTFVTLALNGHVQLDDELVYSVVHQFMHGIYS